MQCHEAFPLCFLKSFIVVALKIFDAFLVNLCTWYPSNLLFFFLRIPDRRDITAWSRLVSFSFFFFLEFRKDL